MGVGQQLYYQSLDKLILHEAFSLEAADAEGAGSGFSKNSRGAFILSKACVNAGELKY